MDPTKLQFVPAVDFYRSVGIHFEFGAKLLKLGVLTPDAWLNQKPIFLADAETVEKAKTAVVLFRARRDRAINNLRERSHA